MVVYNAGSGVWGTFDDITAADLEASWRVNTLGTFLVAKQVVPAMQRAGRGSFVIRRRDRVAAGRCEDRGVRAGQGGAAHARRVARAAAVARGDPRRR